MNEPVARAEWWGQMQESKVIKRDESAEIARQTAEFLASGGKVDRLEVAASSRDPISNQPLEITGVDPMVTKRRATASSNKIREANKAAKKAVEQNARLNLHHIAIIGAVMDLERREVTPTLNEIRKLTGQLSDTLGRRMDVLILRGYITEGVRNYHTTESGRAYIGQVESGKTEV